VKSTRTLRWVIVWLLAWLVCFAAPQTHADSQRVLLLHSFGRDFAPFAAVVESLRSEWDIPDLVKGIHELLPGLRHLYVISGTAPVDQFWKNQAKREC